MTANTPAPLRLLHLEDDLLDAELAATTLKADGLHCDIQRVDSRSAFEATLLADTFDVIVSDYNLPTFDGLTAQSIASRLCPDTPFIFLSGAMGEDFAADRLKDGAADFVLKQRIAKLPVAIRRARREADLRDQSLRAKDEVRRLNAELESRVKQKTADLATTNATLIQREAELEASRRLLQSILDFSPLVIQVKNLEGRYVLLNTEAARVLRRSVGDIIGKLPHDVMPPRVADVLQAHNLDVIEAKASRRSEEVMPQPDGLHVFATVRFPLYDADGGMTGVCGISQDITEQKKADDELRLARLEAVRANQAKSAFLSQMSHELRTPLNAILGFAQLMELDHQLPHEHREGAGQILRGGRHLLDLINEVLDISRIESGKLSLSLEPVLVADVVKAAIELVTPIATHRQVSLTVGPLGDSAVQADRQRLSQVLLNLLSNAVKYNRSHGSVTVEVSAPVEGRVRLSVRDTGAGIPQAKLALLFRPFERLGAEGTAVEGTGLGLALSRSLAVTMGGSLGVESVVDCGTTFWVELAVADRPRPQGQAVVEKLNTVERVTQRAGVVLYIEDNTSNVQLMRRVLQYRPGIELLHAPIGEEGLRMTRERRPDLVFLDLHLPDMPGDEVLRRLWQDRTLCTIPVVVMTADATPGLTHQLTAAGATGFVTKPIDIKRVLALVDGFLDRKDTGGAHV